MQCQIYCAARMNIRVQNRCSFPSIDLDDAAAIAFLLAVASHQTTAPNAAASASTAPAIPAVPAELANMAGTGGTKTPVMFPYVEGLRTPVDAMVALLVALPIADVVVAFAAV